MIPASLKWLPGLAQIALVFYTINLTLGTSRGEILEQFPLDLSGYRIELVFPEIYISTAEAFSGIVPQKLEKRIRDTLSQPIETWVTDLVNDFEASVFDRYPQLAKVKEGLYQKKAVYASLSGSGSTLFGIFKK